MKAVSVDLTKATERFRAARSRLPAGLEGLAPDFLLSEHADRVGEPFFMGDKALALINPLYLSGLDDDGLDRVTRWLAEQVLLARALDESFDLDAQQWEYLASTWPAQAAERERKLGGQKIKLPAGSKASSRAERDLKSTVLGTGSVG